MKLLYSDAPACSEPTLKRLLIVAEEIAFMDRPGAMFGEAGDQWGTLAMESPLRAFAGRMDPVPLTVYGPPSGIRATPLFERYAEIDLAEPEFRRTFLDGLEHDPLFSDKL